MCLLWWRTIPPPIAGVTCWAARMAARCACKHGMACTQGMPRTRGVCLRALQLAQLLVTCCSVPTACAAGVRGQATRIGRFWLGVRVLRVLDAQAGVCVESQSLAALALQGPGRCRRSAASAAVPWCWGACCVSKDSLYTQDRSRNKQDASPPFPVVKRHAPCTVRPCLSTQRCNAPCFVVSVCSAFFGASQVLLESCLLLLVTPYRVLPLLVAPFITGGVGMGGAGSRKWASLLPVGGCGRRLCVVNLLTGLSAIWQGGMGQPRM